MLMETSRQWGLYTYEQDWLDREYDNVDVLTKNATLARTHCNRPRLSSKRSA